MSAPASWVYIGVDGGGSRCRARVCGPEGLVRGAAETGPANVHLDFDGALESVRAAISSACRSAGVPEHEQLNARLGIGLAGASSPDVAARVARALSGFRSVIVDGDGVIACVGAHRGQDGGLVIAGTGSVAVLRLNGKAVIIGGRGFMLGDDGSGAWIGRAVLRRALRAYDGLEPTTPLLDTLVAEYRDSPAGLITWSRSAASHAYAALAPRVFAAAATGDQAALQVAREAGSAIGELIRALQVRAAPRISLAGGMAAAIVPYLPPEARDVLEPKLADALDGALILAGLPTRPRPCSSHGAW